MDNAMTGRNYYIQHGYDELPEAVRIEMRRVFDTGVNNSGVWVRYKEVENLAGVMAYQYTHRPVATNADRIRAMSDEELADWLCSISSCHTCDAVDQCGRGTNGWISWLRSPADGGDGDGL